MLRTSSICTNFIYNYVVNDCEYNEEDTESEKKSKRLKHVLNELKSYGGVLSKMSQIISMNDSNSQVYSDCKPYSTKKTIEYFKKICQTDMYIKDNVSSIDYNVFKSGSVGQIHKAVYNKSPIIFKVQYVGLLEQTMSDLKLVDFICSYVFNFSNMKNAIRDIKNKMNEELNYKIEASNHQLMIRIHRKSDYVKIPKIIPELCTDKMLCTEFVDGQNLSTFIEHSTDQQRHNIGVKIINFIFENIYTYGILYSDIHYGNFLIKNNNLYVVDFGCLTMLDEKLRTNLIKLHKSIINKNKKLFYSTVEDMGIINKNISQKSKQYIYTYFLLQYMPWTTNNFEFNEDWLDTITDLDAELMEEWILPENMVYFNKIPHTLCYILTKLKLKGYFGCIFDKIFENEKELLEKI